MRKILPVGTVFIGQALLMALLFPTTAARAESIAEHIGLSDPETEGWTHQDLFGDVGDEGPGNETTESGDHEFWNIQNALDNTNGYLQFTCLEVVDVDWTFEASVRIVDSPIIPKFGVGGTFVGVGDGINQWGFYIENDIAGPAAAAGFGYLFSVPINTRIDYRNYRIEVSTNGVGAEDDTADFYIDNALVADDVGRAGLFPSGLSRVLFGAASSAGTSDANYELLRLDLDLEPDVDGDGIANNTDNCLNVSNPTQRDTDGDGFGNICDADLTNDGATNFEDLGVMKTEFFGNDPNADLNGDGQVNFIDLGIMKSLFFLAPGPSCAPAAGSRFKRFDE